MPKLNDYSMTARSLKILGIRKDKFSLNDLEERFIRRSEFSQLLKIEEANKASIQQLKSSEILKVLNSMFENQVLDLEFADDRIQLNWKIKPNKIKMDQAELKILKLMMNKNLEFSHSVLLK